MEVHKELGIGFKEVIYKDALEIEFARNSIYHQREKRFDVRYKEILLPHSFAIDFIVYDKIILEVKATSLIVNEFVRQTLNYLKSSVLQLGIIANFGASSLAYKRIIF